MTFRLAFGTRLFERIWRWRASPRGVGSRTALNAFFEHFVLQFSDWRVSDRLDRDDTGTESFRRGAGFFSRSVGGELNAHRSVLTDTPLSRQSVPPGSSGLCFAGNGRRECTDSSIRTPGALLEFVTYSEAT